LEVVHHINPALSLRKSEVINVCRKSGTSRQGTPIPGSYPETLDGAAPAIPRDIMAKPNAVNHQNHQTSAVRRTSFGTSFKRSGLA